MPLLLATEQIILSLLLSLFHISVFAQQGAKSPSIGLTADEQKAAAHLETKRIREVTTVLSSKEMEGRGTGQPGADRAAKYLADKFAELGLQPGGDARTYLQTVKFLFEQPSPNSSFKAADMTFKFKEDFVIPVTRVTESKDVSGRLVFVGYGVVSEKLQRDDLKGLDVNGKVVMALGGKLNHIAGLAGRGATGVIVVLKDEFSSVASHPNRRHVVRLAESPAVSSGLPPVIVINEQTAEKLFVGQDVTFAKVKQMAEAGEWVSRDLNIPISLSVRYHREEKAGSNVIAVLEGSDPALKDQAVVFTAHYDAFGIDASGTIYPGAADNALSVGKLIAIAESLKKAKVQLRRSIIFIALIGEEYGMLGAQYWVNHPTWPLEKVAANINYDGIGTDVWGSLGIIIDYNFNHSDLGNVIKEVAALNGVDIVPDPMLEQGAFYRSDHYIFCIKGVPSLFLMGAPKPENLSEFLARVKSWLASNYHQPTDTIKPDWNWGGARMLSIFGMVTGMRVANQGAIPAWRSDSPYNRPRGNNLPPPARP